MSSNGNHFENDDALVAKMQKMMSEKDARISYLEKKLNDANNEISLKDRNIDQLRSVLYQKNDYLDFNGVHNNGKQNCRSKKFGIIGETFDPQKSDPVCPQPKEIHLRERIKDALLKNEFLSNLEISQIDDMIKYMHEITIEMNSYIIKEGDDGDALYVCLDGKFEVWKENRLLGLMENDRAFGELALLYNCNRTASVKAIRKSNLWKLDRKTFQYIMFSSTIKRQEVTLNFLKTIPALRNLSMKKLLKLADVVEQINYKPNDYIIRENEVGEAFFIIVRGSALVSQTNEHGQEKEIRRLTQGDWFGEKALYTLERRSANVRAIDNVELLSLDRGNFIYLIGNLNEIKSKDYSDHENKANSGYSNNNEASSENSVESAQDEEWLRLIEKQDLITIGILGIGGFGRVELVRWAKDENHVFALKCMKKHHIVHTKQQQHIISEREILIGIRSPFICRLYKTYKDSKYVYMLIEPCLGGELWTILRNKGNFDDTITRFVIACVLEAFTFLHTKGILYRDLKPENLLLDSRGYIKMCDFGFAKKVGVGRKTWTFCGTPEYVAPEIILNKGHDHSADYWSLGILMFELLTGSPPFSGVDPMKIYNIILRGIEAIEFPPNQISKNAGNLIRKLCVQSPVERLGYGRGGIVDIKQNRYFQGFDWIGLHRGVSVSPIVPKIKSNTDMSNFDIFHYTRESPPDELSGWDQDY